MAPCGVGLPAWVGPQGKEGCGCVCSQSTEGAGLCGVFVDSYGCINIEPDPTLCNIGRANMNCAHLGVMSLFICNF